MSRSGVVYSWRIHMDVNRMARLTENRFTGEIDGKPIKPYKLCFTCPLELLHVLKSIAANEDRCVSNLIVHILSRVADDYVTQNGSSHWISRTSYTSSLERIVSGVKPLAGQPEGGIDKELLPIKKPSWCTSMSDEEYAEWATSQTK